MKVINKGNEPNRLGAFRAANPNALWQRPPDDPNVSFRCCSFRYVETQQQLRSDQGNICAYCEVDLLSGTMGVLDDCRVEHFHPKSQRLPGEPNWALHWHNLLAVCCGGNQKSVANSSERFENNSEHHTCDVPKGDKILDSVILNPIDLPGENIWLYQRSTGEISVDEDSCVRLGVDIDMAQNTILELNLNSPRLTRARKAMLNGVIDQIKKKLDLYDDVSKAKDEVARALLTKNSVGDLPSFFSAIRWYLGESAEAVLTHPL